MKVNGVVVTTLGAQVDPHRDSVTLDGMAAEQQSELVYILLNKPGGYLVSATDTRGRKTVFDLLDGVPYRVFSVGRLDYDAEGALLLTNDGELAHRLMHPRYEIKKVYLAWVRGVPDVDDLEKLRQGIRLPEGLTSPAQLTLRQTRGGNALVELSIHEGRKRQVKRMCEAIGHPVEGLSRKTFAGIGVEGLGRGEWRYLKPAEVESLRRQTGVVR